MSWDLNKGSIPYINIIIINLQGCMLIEHNRTFTYSCIHMNHVCRTKNNSKTFILVTARILFSNRDCTLRGVRVRASLLLTGFVNRFHIHGMTSLAQRLETACVH